MGIAATFGEAFAKSQIAANSMLPKKGKIFVSVKDEDKRNIVFLAKKLMDLGFLLIATRGTAKVLQSSGVKVEVVDKHGEGKNNLLTLVKKNEINLIINTPSGQRSQSDMRAIRAAAILYNVPCITTLQGAWAAVNGIESSLTREFTVQSLQEYYSELQSHQVTMSQEKT